MRPLLLASFIVLASGSAWAQPVSGACTGTDCPLSRLSTDLDAATDLANRACSVPPDEAVVAKFRSGQRLTPDEFVRFVAPLAQASERATGVPASVTIAQAALETGWGRSARSAANNLFGIKGGGTAGSVKLWTREYVRGRWVKVRASFAAFRTMADSVIAHGRLVSDSPVYTRAMALKHDPFAFATALQRAGYATDPRYGQLLSGIMRNRNLTRFNGSQECS